MVVCQRAFGEVGLRAMHRNHVPHNSQAQRTATCEEKASGQTGPRKRRSKRLRQRWLRRSLSRGCRLTAYGASHDSDGLWYSVWVCTFASKVVQIPARIKLPSVDAHCALAIDPSIDQASIPTNRICILAKYGDGNSSTKGLEHGKEGCAPI